MHVRSLFWMTFSRETVHVYFSSERLNDQILRRLWPANLHGGKILQYRKRGQLWGIKDEPDKAKIKVWVWVVWHKGPVFSKFKETLNSWNSFVCAYKYDKDTTFDAKQEWKFHYWILSPRQDSADSAVFHLHQPVLSRARLLAHCDIMHWEVKVLRRSPSLIGFIPHSWQQMLKLRVLDGSQWKVVYRLRYGAGTDKLSRHRTPCCTDTWPWLTTLV
jgi:hypothetical protein